MHWYGHVRAELTYISTTLRDRFGVKLGSTADWTEGGAPSSCKKGAYGRPSHFRLPASLRRGGGATGRVGSRWPPSLPRGHHRRDRKLSGRNSRTLPRRESRETAYSPSQRVS